MTDEETETSDVKTKSVQKGITDLEINFRWRKLITFTTFDSCSNEKSSNTRCNTMMTTYVWSSKLVSREILKSRMKVSWWDGVILEIIKSCRQIEANLVNYYHYNLAAKFSGKLINFGESSFIQLSLHEGNWLLNLTGKLWCVQSASNGLVFFPWQFSSFMSSCSRQWRLGGQD